MHLKFRIMLVIFSLTFFTICHAKINTKDQLDFPVLKGPYLGQKPPGMTPEIFAPGIISTEKYELNSVFSLQGDEFYYVISTTTPEEKSKGIYFYVVMYSKQVNGVWTKPRMAPFSGEYMTVDIAFSPDGNRLYFCSDRPSIWDSSSGLDIWYVERVDDCWSELVHLCIPVNSPEGETQPTFTNDGTLYFPSARTGSKGGVDLYYAKYENSKYIQPVNLGDAINTQYKEGNSFVAPDESYLLFARWGMPDSIDGGKGFYISFKKKDGSWTQAINVKPTINTNGSLAALSPDGKYLFYSQGGDIYWVDAKIIEELKPEELK